MLQKQIAGIFIAIIFASCGGSDGSSSDASALVGTWKTDCLPSNDILEATFTGDQLTTVVYDYGEGPCTEEKLEIIRETKSTIKVEQNDTIYALDETETE